MRFLPCCIGALLLAAPLFSQTPILHIDCGSATDAYFSGGVACQAGSACMPDAMAWPPTLRYSQGSVPFGYNLPLPPGRYVVRLGFLDKNKTRAGQRVFAVTANGATTGPMDIFALAGNLPYWRDLVVSAANSGIALLFASTSASWNAIVSTIDVFPYPLPTSGPKGDKGDPGPQGPPGTCSCPAPAGPVAWTEDGGATLAVRTRSGLALKFGAGPDQPYLTLEMWLADGEYPNFGVLSSDGRPRAALVMEKTSIGGWAEGPCENTQPPDALVDMRGGLFEIVTGG